MFTFCVSWRHVTGRLVLEIFGQMMNNVNRSSIVRLSIISLFSIVRRCLHTAYRNSDSNARLEQAWNDWRISVPPLQIAFISPWVLSNIAWMCRRVHQIMWKCDHSMQMFVSCMFRATFYNIILATRAVKLFCPPQKVQALSLRSPVSGYPHVPCRYSKRAFGNEMYGILWTPRRSSWSKTPPTWHGQLTNRLAGGPHIVTVFVVSTGKTVDTILSDISRRAFRLRQQSFLFFSIYLLRSCGEVRIY